MSLFISGRIRWARSSWQLYLSSLQPSMKLNHRKARNFSPTRGRPGVVVLVGKVRSPEDVVVAFSTFRANNRANYTRKPAS
jgi:hypothetical protein